MKLYYSTTFLYLQGSVYWQFSGVKNIGHQEVNKDDNHLQLKNVEPDNSGNYTCHRDEDDAVIITYSLLVPGEMILKKYIFHDAILLF